MTQGASGSNMTKGRLAFFGADTFNTLKNYSRPTNIRDLQLQVTEMCEILPISSSMYSKSKTKEFNLSVPTSTFSVPLPIYPSNAKFPLEKALKPRSIWILMEVSACLLPEQIQLHFHIILRAQNWPLMVDVEPNKQDDSQDFIKRNE